MGLAVAKQILLQHAGDLEGLNGEGSRGGQSAMFAAQLFPGCQLVRVFAPADVELEAARIAS